jgi:hypothetical protein
MKIHIKVLSVERIKWVHPDCGFWMLRRSVADRKMRSWRKGEICIADDRPVRKNTEPEQCIHMPGVRGHGRNGTGRSMAMRLCHPRYIALFELGHVPCN